MNLDLDLDTPPFKTGVLLNTELPTNPGQTQYLMLLGGVVMYAVEIAGNWGLPAFAWY
jgi:hypothetical protein